MQVRHKGLFRFGLLIVALPQLAISTWALAAPRSFYDDFPGLGRHWIPPLGPFNEHFITDYGSFTLALAVLLIIAAVMLDRRVVQVALSVWIVGAIPHFVWHAFNSDPFDATDTIGNLGGLALYVLVPGVLLFLTTRKEP